MQDDPRRANICEGAWRCVVDVLSAGVGFGGGGLDLVCPLVIAGKLTLCKEGGKTRALNQAGANLITDDLLQINE